MRNRRRCEASSVSSGHRNYFRKSPRKSYSAHLYEQEPFSAAKPSAKWKIICSYRVWRKPFPRGPRKKMLEPTMQKLATMYEKHPQRGSDGLLHELDSMTKIRSEQILRSNMLFFRACDCVFVSCCS